MLFKACVALCATFLAADVSAVGTIVKPTGIVQATLEYCSLAQSFLLSIQSMMALIPRLHIVMMTLVLRISSTITTALTDA